MDDLKVDPQRLAALNSDGGTGIWIRAEHDGRWDNHDIAALDADSLLAWLKSRGGDNPIAENMVGHLLGHGRLHQS